MGTNDMLKLLFVDDQLDDESSSASDAVRRLEKIDGYSVNRANFSDAEQKIDEIIPDLIILDLQEKTVSGKRNFTGNGTCGWIWENRFCPIVVYSAFPEELPDMYKSHPFIEVVTKGIKGVDGLRSSITKLIPHIESILEAERNIRKEFSVAMREVAPYAYDTFRDTNQRDETIKRSGRCRLAALMDGLSKDGTELASWEQYLCPPVCPDTQLGDILRKTDGSMDPASFRVVLTPSCDLVASGGRKPKVENVLLARCCSIEGDEGALARIQMKPGQKKLNNEKKVGEFKDQLTKNVLTQGYLKTIIPFPCLKGKIPTMAADLRKLELILLADIGKNFLRIASIDSPFRELVSWAYLQIACRPGLPDRDFNAWSDEIVALLKKENEEGCSRQS
ncbi:MAG: response regulator [Gammaproteobacteria bacterium]|nr:response regulator [Gammaproteobacteria bacterium]